MKYLFYALIFFTLSLQAVDNFVVITPEKTGTHLLTRAMTLLTGKEVINKWEREEFDFEIQRLLQLSLDEGKYFHMHAFYKKKVFDLFKQSGFKVIYLIRDPRDTLVSVYHYILDRGWEFENLSRDGPFGKLGKDEQIEELITGKLFGNSIPNDFFGKRWGWYANSETCTVKFEKLVGAKGGGDREEQIMELKKLAHFIHLYLPEEKFQEIADQLYGWPGLKTFRVGKIGTWREYFNEEHIKQFKRVFGQELVEMGYESDLKW